jgi:hypothetical protein
MKTLLEQYNEIAEEYRLAFFEKHDFEDPEWYWVADVIGDVLHVNDYYFGYDQIRHDIDNNLDANVMFEYYEYSLDKGMKNETPVNLDNYCKGIR